jgi:hypothetical protein
MVLEMVMDEWLTVIEQEHEVAVARLNQSLNLKGDSLLDPNVPPHTYVGDIDNVSPSECILLLGINPKRNFDENFQRVNIELPTKCLQRYRISNNIEDLEEWLLFQNQYFLREERNRRYFNKYGSWLGKHWFTETVSNCASDDWKQMVCHKHLIEVDTVQYFSHKTGLNPEHLADLIETDPALQANMRMIEAIIKKIKPKWIQVTGKSGWVIIERLFGYGEFTETNPGLKHGTELKMGHVKIGDTVTPVLMTKFFGSMAGVNSNIEKDQVAQAWNSWLSEQ